jgi:hypothetical protein
MVMILAFVIAIFPSGKSDFNRKSISNPSVSDFAVFSALPKKLKELKMSFEKYLGPQVQFNRFESLLQCI